VLKKPLIESNPYLRDPARRRKALIINVSGNTSVETGRKAEAIARALSREERTRPLKARRGSGR
jgi:hypothetical protein